MIATSMKAISKAYTTLRNIESEADLKKNKMTLADYHAAKEVFKQLTTPGNSTTTFISNVAAFFEKCNFNVVLDKGQYIIWTEGK